MARSEALGLRLELDVVFGLAAPVICLPGEDPGRRTYAPVVATGQGPLSKHPRTLEIAAMFRSSPGGVEPAGARIVVFTQLGCALERSRSRRLSSALGKSRGGSFERCGNRLVGTFGGRC